VQLFSLLALFVFSTATAALEASPNHCLHLCETAPMGTPCETLGASCVNGESCKCRKPPLEFRKYENEALEQGGDIEGFTPGTECSLEVCRAECLARNLCLAITYSPKGECWLKRFTGSLNLTGWQSEKKMVDST